MPKLDSFRVKLVNFQSENFVLVVCYDHNTSTVIGQDKAADNNGSESDEPLRDPEDQFRICLQAVNDWCTNQQI